MSTRFINRGLSNTVPENAGIKRQERDKSHDQSMIPIISAKADVNKSVPSNPILPDKV